MGIPDLVGLVPHLHAVNVVGGKLLIHGSLDQNVDIAPGCALRRGQYFERRGPKPAFEAADQPIENLAFSRGVASEVGHRDIQEAGQVGRLAGDMNVPLRYPAIDRGMHDLLAVVSA